MRNIILAVTMLTFIMAGCVTGQTRNTGKPQFTKHFEDSIFKVTDKELFSVEISPDRKELGVGDDALGIIIHDANDKDVEGAGLEVSVYIPEESSSPKLLYVAEKAGGLYSVKKIDLGRKGQWEIRVKVKKGNMEDSVVFYFPGAK